LGKGSGGIITRWLGADGVMDALGSSLDFFITPLN